MWSNPAVAEAMTRTELPSRRASLHCTTLLMSRASAFLIRSEEKSVLSKRMTSPTSSANVLR